MIGIKHAVAALAGMLISSAFAGEVTFLDNGTIKLGVRQDRGASISYLSRSGSDKNLLNAWDTGRCVQQSYYGESDGSMWGKNPWRWNPVQGGHYKGSPAEVLTFEAKPTTLYSKTTPKHWATGAAVPEMAMEQWIELRGAAAKVHFKMTYSGTKTHPERHQEVPAFFVDASLSHLVFYKGDQPWTKAAVTRVVPGWPNEPQRLDERWAAYVDDADQGVGFFNAPAAEATTYRYLPTGAAPGDSCSYIAPVATFAITPGLVYEYDLYLMIGTSAEIREAAYRLHSEASKPTP